jgi:hypothetical protein
MQLVVGGRDSLQKARHCAEIIQHRLRRADCLPQRFHVECLGAGAAAPELAPAGEPREIVLRIAVHDPRREVVERFTQEAAPLITSGPAGIAGYATGRSPVRPMFAYWPTIVPKDLVPYNVEVRRAESWG